MTAPRALLVLGMASVAASSHVLQPEGFMAQFAPEAYSAAPLADEAIFAWAKSKKETLKKCAAPDNSLWLFGTEHKTGTALVGGFLKAVSKAGGPSWMDATGDGFMYEDQKKDKKISHTCNAQNSFAPNCLKKVHSYGVHAMKSNSLAVQLDAKYQATHSNLKQYEHKFGRKVRVAYWVRDALDRIVSAYFYHLNCPESWCLEKGGALMHDIENICQNGKVKFYSNDASNKFLPADEACAPDKVKWKAHKHSYKSLLNSIPFEAGVLMEAWRSAGITIGMVEAQQHIRGDKYVDAYSLTDAMASHHSCMHKAAIPQFKHLGLASENVFECAKLFCEMVEVGMTGKHSTHKTNQHAKYKALHILKQHPWVHANLGKAIESQYAATQSKATESEDTESEDAEEDVMSTEWSLPRPANATW